MKFINCIWITLVHIYNTISKSFSDKAYEEVLGVFIGLGIIIICCLIFGYGSYYFLPHIFIEKLMHGEFDNSLFDILWIGANTAGLFTALIIVISIFYHMINVIFVAPLKFCINEFRNVWNNYDQKVN